MVQQTGENAAHAVADTLIGVGAPVVVVALFVIGVAIHKTHEDLSRKTLILAVGFMVAFGAISLVERMRGEITLSFHPDDWQPRAASLSPVAVAVGVSQGHRMLLADTIVPEADQVAEFSLRAAEEDGADRYAVVVDTVEVGVIEAEEILRAGFHRQGHATDGRAPLWTTLRIRAGDQRTWDCETGFHLRIRVDSVTTQGVDYLAHLRVGVRRAGDWVDRSRAVANKKMSGFYFDRDEVFVGVREAGEGEDGAPWVAVTAFPSPASTVSTQGCGA